MNRSITYFIQLDSVRAIAVIGVMILHFTQALDLPVFMLGHYGVDLFFCISGFLITLILLTQKEAVPVGPLLKSFFIKRILRLFPAYYTLLIIVILIKIVLPELYVWKEGYGWWYFSYLPNILFFQEGFQSPLLNHSWSLAVEEQFYLVWPFLLLFLPKPVLPYFFGLFICTAIVLHVLYSPSIRMLPFGNLHTLCGGALLAWCYKKNVLHYFQNAGKSILLFSLAGSLALLIYLDVSGINSKLLTELVVLFMSTGMVLVAVHGLNGTAGKLLSARPLLYTGKISYGLYLFHKPIPVLAPVFFNSLNIPFPNKWLLFLIYFLLSFLAAAVSWKIIETPFLKLKSKADQ